MVIKLRFLIIGLKKEILGKLNVKISLMKFVFMVSPLSIRMVQLKEHVGKIAKKLLQWLMIHLFLDLIHITQTI